jgi:hypothetical protein
LCGQIEAGEVLPAITELDRLMAALGIAGEDRERLCPTVGLAVRSAVSIVAEALGCDHPDRARAAELLGDP